MPSRRWVQTDMGNSAATISGMDQAPMSIKDSVTAILLVVSTNLPASLRDCVAKFQFRLMVLQGLKLQENLWIMMANTFRGSDHIYRILRGISMNIDGSDHIKIVYSNHLEPRKLNEVFSRLVWFRIPFSAFLQDLL